jgi:hypothetical protein
MAHKLDAISLMIRWSIQMCEEGRMPEDVKKAHQDYWSGALD